MTSEHSDSQPAVISSSFSSFIKGAGVGLIVFLLVGGVWQVSHFWWVMAGTSLFCGLINAVFHVGFKETLTVLLDNLPWI
ncbi:MAG: hypothetical protein ACFB16_04680 [Phormidesmis sp.]